MAIVVKDAASVVKKWQTNASAAGQFYQAGIQNPRRDQTQTAIAAQNWLMDRGTLVPQQVKITGFNAFDFARFARPALTTIKSPAYELGDVGASELLRRLETGIFAEREIVLPVTLEIGQSA